MVRDFWAGLYNEFSNVWRIVKTISWLSKGVLCADAGVGGGRSGAGQMFSKIVLVWFF